jgi:hypothetical protein
MGGKRIDDELLPTAQGRLENIREATWKAVQPEKW